MPYEVIINKKYTYVKLYNVVKSVKGEQNKLSKIMTDLVNKYVLKKPEAKSDRL